MGKLKNKKFVVSLAGIVLMLVLVVGVQVKASANERIEEYQKYCQNDCELTKVSNEQLEQTIDTRKVSAIASIEESSKSINKTTKYLNEQKINDEESKTLDSLKPETKYSEDKEYTVDQLIEMESNYKEVSKKLSNLKTEYRTRYLTPQIKSNQKAINKTKTSLKDYDLTSEETKTKKSLDKKLTFDSKKEYTVDELDELNKTYKAVKGDYSTLLSDVKVRVADEKAQAEANATAQEQIVDYSQTEDYSTDYNTDNATDYSNDTSASTTNANTSSSSSTSKSTSNSSNNSSSSSNTEDACYDSQGRYNSSCIGSDGGTSGNGAGLPDNICPYSSESAAISAAEKQIETNNKNGYSTTVCDQGTWDIYWF